VLVLELNPRLDPAEVVEARDHLVKVFTGAAPVRQG